MRSLFLCLLCLPVFASAQSIYYTVEAPNAAHHEAEITVTVQGAKTDSVEFVMSKASPGRYATHEFAKNVYNVRAVDAKNNPLTVVKSASNAYKVKNAATIKLTYTLFANRADGTYAGIARNGYQLNIPASFIWVRGLDQTPVSVEFKNLPEGWSVASQLFPTAKKEVFTAPNFQYFMDSPIKVGKLHWRNWTVKNPNGKTYTIELALEADAPAVAIDSFTNNLKKVVDESIAIFGEVPEFDNGKFTFIASLNPYIQGDGMEHRNSTIVNSRRQFDGSNSFMGTFAHEFFHAWNVERIRPKSLEPFQYDQVNMSEALWLAEGFTQYYTSVIMTRAGLMTPEVFLRSMNGLINSKESAPGGKYSAVENSQRAVFVDAGVAVDETNYQNMFSSYYSHGGALGLALDLQLRSQFNKTLDDFMTALWVKHGKTEIPYTLPDVEKVLESITNKSFAQKFFNDYVYNSRPINYSTLLNQAGYELALMSENSNWIGGGMFRPGKTGLVVEMATRKFTPLYDAGLDVGDEIISVNGVTVKKKEDLDQVINSLKIGESVNIEFISYGDTIQSKLKIEANPAQVIRPMTNKTSAQEAFVQKWIGAKRK
jgi:predicted metalloprotease with PDZ domain